MKDKSLTEKLNSLLIKIASGYTYTETTEEYVLDKQSNEMTLSKKKVSSHHVPPDMLAIKMLLSGENQFDELMNMSDQELIELKDKLIKEIQSGQVCD